MSAHTPGPWAVEQDATNALDIVAGHSVVATIIADDDIPEGDCEDRANARLISAAPDSAAACRVLFNRWSNTGPGSPHRILGNADAAMLRAVLDKVDGR